MNFFKLANILDKKISALRIEPNLCTQTISPKSSCKSCLDACPTDSISIADRKIEIDDHCLECGLCSTVCPTNAFLFERPSTKQVLEEVERKCRNQEHVYIQCKKLASSASHTSSVKIPCLGMLPREGWLKLLNDFDNLSIFHDEDSCRNCEVSTGFVIWQKELHAAEEIAGKKINITNHIQKSNKQASFDQDRRELFSLFASELKSTNKLVVKEVLGESKVTTYQEKLQENELSKVKKEWEHVSARIVETITHDAALPFMGKRKLFLEILAQNPALREREDIHLPSILPDCNFCGACTLLCPTEALVKETLNEQTTITLYPTKCIDCKLCEEICYFNYIELQPATNKQLLQESKVLAIEKT